MTYSDDELSTKLDEASFNVLRRGATEAPFSGSLLNEHRDGSFHCKVCDAKVFDSSAKFDSGSGWPSFTKPATDAVKLTTDRSHGMIRTEVNCASCGSHLGHLFDDGPIEAGGQRYCVNSVCFNFTPRHGH